MSFDRFALERASRSSTLPSTARLVLWAMIQYCNDRGACWPSAEELGRTTALSARAVTKQVRLLEREGWLQTTAATGRANLYRLTIGEHEPHPPLNHVHPTPEPYSAPPEPYSAPPERGSPRTTQEQAVVVVAAAATTTGQPPPAPDPDPSPEEREESAEEAEATTDPPPSPASEEEDLLAQLLGVSAAWVEEGPTRPARLRRELRQLLGTHGAEVLQEAIEELHAWSEQERIESPPAALRRVVQQRVEARRSFPPPAPLRRARRPDPLPAPVAPPYTPSRSAGGISSAGAYGATAATDAPAKRPRHATASYDRTARREIYWHDDADNGAGAWVFDDVFIELDAARAARRANPSNPR